MAELASALPNLVKKKSHYFTMGKMLRSTLMREIASAVGLQESEIILPAAILELIHTTTILHDDVIDLTLDRRGNKTINAQFKSSVAVFSADLLFSRSMSKLSKVKFQYSHQPNLSAAYTRIEKAVHDFLLEVCVGEMNQDFRPGLDSPPTLKECLTIARAKTGALFALSALIPACLIEIQESSRLWLQEAGAILGTIFQLLDDLPDVEFDSRETVNQKTQFKHWTYSNVLWSRLDGISWELFLTSEAERLPEPTRKIIMKQVIEDSRLMWKTHEDICPAELTHLLKVFNPFLERIIHQTEALYVSH